MLYMYDQLAMPFASYLHIDVLVQRMDDGITQLQDTTNFWRIELRVCQDFMRTRHDETCCATGQDVRISNMIVALDSSLTA